MCFLGANFCIILPTYKSFSKYRHSTVSSLQGLTCPQGASSMCTDAWPFPLGLWLALHQSSRGRAWEGKGWRWEEREEEAREQNTKFHLFWVGWLIFLAWREKLWIQFVPLANCVPESLGGGQKSGKWLISFTVGQVRAGLTCAGMGFVWLRTGQKWMCNTVAMTKGLKFNWIPILLLSILLPSLPAFFVSNLDGEKRERSWCVKEKLGY